MIKWDYRGESIMKEKKGKGERRKKDIQTQRQRVLHTERDGQTKKKRERGGGMKTYKKC